MSQPNLRIVVSLVLLFVSGLGLHAWNARMAPTEATVSWNVYEGLASRAATMLNSEELGGSLLFGEVAVDGQSASTLAFFDSTGNLLWSYRTPAYDGEEGFGGLSPTQDGDLLAEFPSADGTRQLFGAFETSGSLTQRYGFSLPLIPGELEPQTSFLANGDLSIVQVDSLNKKVMVAVLSPEGTQRFAKAIEVPAGDAIIIPGFPPIGGLTYTTASLYSLENGDYYFLTEANDILAQTSTNLVARLDSAGNLLWQAELVLPGISPLNVPLDDEQILLQSAGNVNPESQATATTLVMLNPQGEVEWARQASGALLSQANFLWNTEDGGNLVFSGTTTDGPLDEANFDSVILVLTPSGDFIADAAFDLDDFDFAFHTGTSTDHLYFELYAFDQESLVTQGILVRSDPDLTNWLAHSYVDKIGPSAVGSSLLSETGRPALTYMDADKAFIYFQQLTPDLLPDGECDLVDVVELEVKDPDIAVSPFSVTVGRDSLSMTDWSLSLTPETFEIFEMPLTVEEVCPQPFTGLVSLWDAIQAANPEGDKKAGIGWINDTHYPYVWHYTIADWIYILDTFSSLTGIIGWDYANGFWFWSHDEFGGWYVNLNDPTWGVGGWWKWGDPNP